MSADSPTTMAHSRKTSAKDMLISADIRTITSEIRKMSADSPTTTGTEPKTAEQSRLHSPLQKVTFYLHPVPQKEFGSACDTIYPIYRSLCT